MEELTDLIYKASRDLEAYQTNYEFASDDLIDYYSYKIKAEKAKLDYLVKLAKSKDVVKEDIRAFSLKFKNAT